MPRTIENPTCEIHGGYSPEHGSVSAGFDLGDGRYHVWLTSTGRLPDGATLYKNPRLRPDGTCVPESDPAYFPTRHLDPAAKCNKPLVDQLLAAIDVAQAWKDHRAAGARKKQEERRQRRIARRNARMLEVADAIETELKACVDAFGWAAQRFPASSPEGIQARARLERCRQLVLAIEGVAP
jgi:hypothetical protein